MKVLNVALVGSDELARTIAKSNDKRDIETYVHKENSEQGVRIISILRPLKHPERIRPLLSVLNVARCGVVEVKRIDADLGEVMVAFGCSGISEGHIIINPDEGDWVDADQVKIIMQQAGLSEWVLHEEPIDEHTMRELLFSVLANQDVDEGGPLVIPVDQHFNVKGVGLVAIGYVQSGSINKHDRIVALPTGDGGITRSLQVMDDDVAKAVAGDRVGVAIRDMREAALSRGTILVSEADKEEELSDMIRMTRSKLTLELAPFQPLRVTTGDVIHAAVDLQFVVGRVDEVNGTNLTVTWEQPLFIRRREPPRLLVCQLDAKMRFLGHSTDIASVD